MAEQFAPIPRSEQNYPMPIVYRCWCGAEFPTYQLGDDAGTKEAEKIAHAHRAVHRATK